MKITFIRPNIGSKDHRQYAPSDNLEPLALAILAGLTPKDDEITLFDDRIEEIDYNYPADLVAITVTTHTARRAYQIAGQFRQRGIPVVMGGVHPSLLPEEASRYADAVVVGEAENTWPLVLEDAKTHRLKPLYRAEELPRLEGLKPDRSIFAHKPYLPVSIVEFSRGCPHTCEFCSGAVLFQRKIRHRPHREVIEEIRNLPNRYILFADDNLYACKKAAEELFLALIPLKKKWLTQIHLDFTKDENFIELMSRSGCVGVFVGFESLDSKNLGQMNKGGSTIHRYQECLATIRKYGFCIYGSFLFGYDEDREETFTETLRFAVKERLFSAAFNHLAPYPGTPLYQRMKNTDRLLYDSWWNNPGFQYHQFSFRPRHLSPEKMADLCRKIRRQFHSCPNILLRALDMKTNARNLRNLTLFLTVNFISRRETRGKHGLTFGN
ncbi:MAG: radical SAM protein [bacterium]